MSLNPNLFLSIGKPIKDEYGRIVGKVASFSMTPNGKFDAVFVEFSSGKFSKQPLEQMKFNGAEVTFISTTKSQAIALCDQIPLIWRKDQALKDLSEKKKITPEMYTEIHKSFDGVLTQLKKGRFTGMFVAVQVGGRFRGFVTVGEGTKAVEGKVGGGKGLIDR